MQQVTPYPLTIGIDDAARMLRMSPRSVKAKARRGEIPAAKPGREWVFIPIDLIEYLREQYQGNEECQSKSAGKPTIAGSKSTTRKLENLLARKTARKPNSSKRS